MLTYHDPIGHVMLCPGVLKSQGSFSPPYVLRVLSCIYGE